MRILIILFLLIAGQSLCFPQQQQCQRITVPTCLNMGYNMTSVPNRFHHQRQDEISLEVHQYLPLINAKCSPDLHFFLCAMYVPICLPDFNHQTIPPCRSLCESAKRGCEQLMNRFSYFWPVDLACDQLPERQEVLCVDSPPPKNCK
uniref:FZ domain-containing protein n=1 Tax=Romanomermis culicivorax TaxID=13658 RepID=A0A915JM21_ROMCU